MKKVYTSFDELPLCLNAKDVADILGICVQSVYELTNREDFPAIVISKEKNSDKRKRIVIPRDRFKEWLDSAGQPKKEQKSPLRAVR